MSKRRPALYVELDDPAVLARIKSTAKAGHRSVSSYVRKLLAKAMETAA